MTHDAPPSHTIRCPIWQSPLFVIVPEGIEVRCKSCRKAIHVIRRERIEAAWQEMGQEQISAPSRDSAL
jgi:hypothetical protein